MTDPKDSKGNKHPVDMGLPATTRSTRFEVSVPNQHQSKTSYEVELDSQPLVLSTIADIQALLGDDELNVDSDEDVFEAGDEMDEDIQQANEEKTHEIEGFHDATYKAHEDTKTALNNYEKLLSQLKNHTERDVIEFGDSYEAPQETSGTDSVSEGSAKKNGRTIAVTTKDIQKRRNDVKARTTLLLALPDEHQLRFSKRDRDTGANFQQTACHVSHLEFMDVEIEQDDLNQKFLTSLASEWLISGKEEVNTTSFPTASTQVSPANANVVAASFSHDTVCAYIAAQSNGSQIKYEDINQINEDDIEEMDIKTGPKALMAIDGVKWDWSYMANEEEDHALVADQEASTEFTLMAKSSSDNEVFDNSLCSKACLSQVEARLVEFKIQEIKFYEKIRGLEFDVKNKNTKIENLMNELEQIKKEKEGLDSKLTGFKSASKDLDTFLGSQRSDKNKEDDTITDYSRPSPGIESNSSDFQNNNSTVFEHGESSESIKSIPMIKFVKAADSPGVIKTNKTETARKPPVKYAEIYRNTSKSPKVRGNQRNWNNLMNQRLKSNFVMKNKACFKCGHFDHLEYDCGLWVEKGKNWSKNNFAHKHVTPRADLFKTASVSAVRRVNTASPRPNVNSARPKTTQDLMIIKLIQRVKRLERELKARTLPTKIHYVNIRGRSRFVLVLWKQQSISDSLLLTPLCCDDIHDVMPRVSALGGCDRLVSEPGYREVGGLA
nr:retrotransposon Orf1 [Tanacetum cinerariifolium]